MSAYYLEHACVNHIQRHFEIFEEEARSLLSLGLAIPAYVYFFLNQTELFFVFGMLVLTVSVKVDFYSSTC